tara:strand:+ start:99 stop:668 length:570 start_codon:yes stop_codon:yes gene_type:complete
MFNFESTKKDILGKRDKSNVGNWDDHIVELCDLINASDDYFTTSSCSGRITLVEDIDKKAPGVFLFRTHEKVEFDELKKGLLEVAAQVSEGIVMFKQEPCLVVVSCRDRDSQWRLFSEARNNGWKKSGILSLDRKLLVELMSSENISFPVVKDGKILVDDEFLKVVIDKSNSNLEKGWEKIKSLKKLFE